MPQRSRVARLLARVSFRRFLRHALSPPEGRSRTFRPTLEPLEDRRLFAVAVDDSYAMHSGTTLTFDPTSNDVLRSWLERG